MCIGKSVPSSIIQMQIIRLLLQFPTQDATEGIWNPEEKSKYRLTSRVDFAVHLIGGLLNAKLTL